MEESKAEWVLIINATFTGYSLVVFSVGVGVVFPYICGNGLKASPYTNQ